MPLVLQPTELASWLAAKQPVYLLDVRLPVEHEFVALPGSTLVPLQELTTRLSEVQPGQGDKLVVYCHHGVRSWHAAVFLEQQGFLNVYSLEGGIDAWSLDVDAGVRRYQ